MNVVKSLVYNGRFSVGGFIREISQDQNETSSLKRKKVLDNRKQKYFQTPTEELSQKISEPPIYRDTCPYLCLNV